MKRFLAPVSFFVLSVVGLSLFFSLRSSADGQDKDKDKDKNNVASQIVARINLTNQNTEIPLTTLFEPKEDGLYRVNGYMVTTTADVSATVDISGFFSWTDDASTKQPLLAHSPLLDGSGPYFGLQGLSQLGSYSSISFVVRAKASTPITFYTTDRLNSSTNFGNAQFAVFFTVEKL